MYRKKDRQLQKENVTISLEELVLEKTIERVFADAKECHSLRYINYRDSHKVKFQVTLIFARMNKKIGNEKI